MNAFASGIANTVERVARLQFLPNEIEEFGHHGHWIFTVHFFVVAAMAKCHFALSLNLFFFQLRTRAVFFRASECDWRKWKMSSNGDDANLAHFWKCSCECVNVTWNIGTSLIRCRVVRGHWIFVFVVCNSVLLAAAAFSRSASNGSTRHWCELNGKERKPVRRTWEHQLKMEIVVHGRVWVSSHVHRVVVVVNVIAVYSLCMRFSGFAAASAAAAISFSISSFLFIIAFDVSLPSASACSRTQNWKLHSDAPYLDAVVMNGHVCHLENRNLFLSSLNKLFNDISMKVKEKNVCGERIECVHLSGSLFASGAFKHVQVHDAHCDTAWYRFVVGNRVRCTIYGRTTKRTKNTFKSPSKRALTKRKRIEWRATIPLEHGVCVCNEMRTLSRPGLNFFVYNFLFWSASQLETYAFAGRIEVPRAHAR